MKILPSDFGIEPNTQLNLTQNFATMLDFCQKNNVEGITLETGVYDFYSTTATVERFFISNTVGLDESAPYLKEKREVGIRKVALLLRGLRNFTLDGNGSTFIMHGLMTNVIIEDCYNLSIRNINIIPARPPFSELEVIERNKRVVIFKINKECTFTVKDKKIYFTDEEYCYNPQDEKGLFVWHGVAKAENLNCVSRKLGNVFSRVSKVSSFGENYIEVKYKKRPSYKCGDREFIFFKERLEVGIFIDKSVNVSLTDVKQHSNMCFGICAQRSANISMERVCFEPKEGFHFTSTADFCHFSMCSGYIKVRDCRFIGAGDDVINVHGIHFKITKIERNKIEVKFCHPQAYGFNPIDPGDAIDFVEPSTLKKIAGAVVTQSIMLSSDTIELKLSRMPTCIKKGDVIEDITKTASLEFVGNYCSAVATRGVLVTTRKKVVIKDNTFDFLRMHNVLISDDAKYWYESGRVMDVTIENNVFNHSGQDVIAVIPECKRNSPIVHKNVVIKNNVYVLEKGTKKLLSRNSDVKMLD